MKLGSLFDGSGGFPLAGAMHGIEPAWASEIEPYPIRVTTARFPAMKHLGDITKINGAEIEPVDIITFGSPCQDLSVAGKQAGLEHGARSNLFYQAIRIIKEMRDATRGVYPRVAVWENVPGAFSSHNGKDFQSVLQAFCGIVNEDVDVPKPAKWQSAGCIMGNGFSVAWRTLDAQYWGVPQRRRRIYLVADFGSERAGEILFKQARLPGDTAEGGAPGEGAVDNAERSVGRSGVDTLTGWDVQSRRIHSDKGAWPALWSENSGACGYVLRVGQDPAADAQGRAGGSVLFEPMSALEENWAESTVKNALRAEASKSSHAIVFKERAGCPGGGKGILCGDKPFTLSTLQDQAVCYNQPHRDELQESGVAQGQGSRILQQALHQIQEIWKPIAPQRKYIIRRLSPLECARLQGFPDWWEDGVPGSDSAQYKMWGNSLAIPCAAHVIGCAVKLILARALTK